MHALTRSSIVITFAALSLSSLAAWATGGNSFVAKAELNGFNLIPPIFAETEGEITLTFFKPTTSGAAIARAPGRTNPWATSTRPGANDTTRLENIRLYFGQRFANGLPILTLCDNEFHKQFPAAGIPSCGEENVVGEPNGAFELNRIHFQEGVQRNVQSSAGFEGGACGGLKDDEEGFNTLRNLIKRGLIYVVVTSDFKAASPDPSCPGNIIYTPPAPFPTDADPSTNVTQGDLTTQFRDLFLIIDGDLRGTLRLVK